MIFKCNNIIAVSVLCSLMLLSIGCYQEGNDTDMQTDNDSNTQDTGNTGNTDNGISTDSETETIIDTNIEDTEYELQDCSGEIVFYDSILEEAIRSTLSINNKAVPITGADAASVSQLLFYEVEGVADIRGLECFTNLLFLYFGKGTISDLRPLSKLNKLAKLSVGGNLVSDLSIISDLTSLENLYIGYNLINDLSPLKKLSRLIHLDISDNPIIDLSPIAELPNLKSLTAQYLGLKDLTLFENLTGLSGLYLDFNEITDIAPVCKLTKLAGLTLTDNLVSDISCLSDIENLHYFKAAANKIKDVSALSKFRDLSTVDLGYNEIEDISALGQIPRIYELFLDHNQITSIVGIPEFVQYLYIHDNLISDLSPLIGHPWLDYTTEFDFAYNQIEDLSPIALFPMVMGLDIHGNRVTDLTPLASHPELRFLNIAENNVQDISPLAALKFEIISAWDNMIHDISPLMVSINSNSMVNLMDNRISDISALAEAVRSGFIPMDVALSGNPLDPMSEKLDIASLCDARTRVFWALGNQCEWDTEPNTHTYQPNPDPPPYDNSSRIYDEKCDTSVFVTAQQRVADISRNGEVFLIDESTASQPVVVDKDTGLEWRRCSVGQTWDGALCVGKPYMTTFDGANPVCDDVYAEKDDWRVPNNAELSSLVDFSSGFLKTAIDEEAFPDTYTGKYLSSSTVKGTFDQARFHVNFFSGEVSIVKTNETAAIRCVRNTSIVPPSDSNKPRFEISDDEQTVKDILTGLEWSRCLAGTEWGENNCINEAQSMTPEAASSLCSEKNGFRLPNIRELESLINYCDHTPAVFVSVFGDSKQGNVWSSTKSSADESVIWQVSFDYGMIKAMPANQKAHVRCVK